MNANEEDLREAVENIRNAEVPNYFDDLRDLVFDYRVIVNSLNGTKELEEPKLNLLHQAIGIHTEGGEIADCVKKHVFYNQDLNVENLKEEIGDILWYITNLMTHINYDFGDAMLDNAKKLLKRYPEGHYKHSAALERADKKREPSNKERLNDE